MAGVVHCFFFFWIFMGVAGVCTLLIRNAGGGGCMPYLSHCAASSWLFCRRQRTMTKSECELELVGTSRRRRPKSGWVGGGKHAPCPQAFPPGKERLASDGDDPEFINVRVIMDRNTFQRSSTTIPRYPYTFRCSSDTFGGPSEHSGHSSDTFASPSERLKHPSDTLLGSSTHSGGSSDTFECPSEHQKRSSTHLNHSSTHPKRAPTTFETAPERLKCAPEHSKLALVIPEGVPEDAKQAPLIILCTPERLNPASIASPVAPAIRRCDAPRALPSRDRIPCWRKARGCLQTAIRSVSRHHGGLAL